MQCITGADPSQKYGLHYSPIEMAAEQGAVRALQTAMSCLPENPSRSKNGIMDHILIVLFNTSCYDCINGKGPTCQRCLHDSQPHPKNASFTGCVDVLLNSGYVPTKRVLISLHQMHSFKPDLFQYILQSAVKVSTSLKMLQHVTSKEAWENMCSSCAEDNVKTMMCSGLP